MKAAEKAAAEEAVLNTIAAMPGADRAIAERLHAVITASAPDLAAKLWYRRPAYARGDKVICFFRGAEVDRERYLTLGFSSAAKLDDGARWPTSFAVTALTDADEATIAAFVKKAAG